MTLIGLHGLAPERKHLESVLPNALDSAKNLSWDILFICEDLGALSVDAAALRLKTITDHYASRLYVLSGLTPIGLVDRVKKIAGINVLKLVTFGTNTTPRWLIGGDRDAIDSFTQSINPSSSTIIIEDSLGVKEAEAIHFLKSLRLSIEYVLQETITSFCLKLDLEARRILDPFSRLLSEVSSLDQSETGRELKSLELYLRRSGGRVDFVNALRRENAALSRRSESHDSPFSNENAIYFHEVDKAFGDFSNFSDHPVFIDGVIWKTVEHYYQVRKFVNQSLRDQIRRARSPVMAKDLADVNKNDISGGWDKIKRDVMLDGVRAKFYQHPDLATTLTETDKKEIVEYSEDDRYWGDPGDGSGQNYLGKILMLIRDELKSQT